MLTEYLRDLLSRKQNNSNYTKNELDTYTKLYGLINQWKQNYNNNATHIIFVEMEKSGSRAKGDAIKGKSDIDIFVSIDDKDNAYTVKDYYESLYTFLKSKLPKESMRKQNVSIGISYAGCSVDITPGKRIKQALVINIMSYYDHYIYSRKNDKNTKTNIQKHIALVKGSGLADIMMLLKIWRNCHGLELPSIAIEIITAEVLKNSNKCGLYNKFKFVLEVLRDTIMDRKIIDPANSNNNIADSMSLKEKQIIRDTAIESLGYDEGERVWTSKIVW